MNLFPLSLLAVILIATSVVHASSPSQQIDALLATAWAKHQFQPNPPATDETFFRRAYLDIIGRIPTTTEAREFLGATGESKRALLIDKLLASEGYAQHMFNFWADILRAQSVGYPSTGITSSLYVSHLQESLRANKPYDQFVRDLVSAEGKIWENGAAGYYMRDRGMPLDNMANTARIFLGTRLECAQCHNHPFDKWTQMQFYQMAAFTYGINTNYPGIREMPGAISLMVKDRNAREARLKSAAPAERAQIEREAQEARWIGKALDDLGDRTRYVKIHFEPRNELRLPHDYQYSDAPAKSPVQAATVLGPPAQPGAEEPLPSAYARWLASPENPRFAKVIANRLWKKAFGLGLIEPIDDITDKTAPSNPELLQFLEKLMIELRYDTKAYLRVLYNTRAYQAAVTPREIAPGEPYHFTGPLLRRMSAEQIWDSFVALIHPEPDRRRPASLDHEVAVKIGQARKISDALDSLSAAELFEGAQKASRIYESTSARANELKDQYAAAQKAKDKEAMSRLNAEIRAQNSHGRSAANDALVIPAVARLYTKATGQPAPAAPPSREHQDAMMMGKGAMRQHNYIAVPGYDLPEADGAAEKARREALRQQWTEEARRTGLAAADLGEYLTTREKQEQEWLRASELNSPAPRGHFLREFGQSDREVIENANYEASVPQALALMNGDLLPQLTHRFSQLMLALEKASAPDEKLGAAYLALFSRAPSDQEKALWSAARAKGLDSTEDLISALINTQQFLFIQ